MSKLAPPADYAEVLEAARSLPPKEFLEKFPNTAQQAVAVCELSGSHHLSAKNLAERFGMRKDLIFGARRILMSGVVEAIAEAREGRRNIYAIVAKMLPRPGAGRPACDRRRSAGDVVKQWDAVLTMLDAASRHVEQLAEFPAHEGLCEKTKRLAEASSRISRARNRLLGKGPKKNRR